MGNWTDAQRTVRQLADIINDKCLISFRTPEDNQENSTKVTSIYVSLIPLEGYIPALKWMPNLMAMIFNHLTADRKLIYQQFTDNHSFFTIHPCDWKKDSEKLFSDPETDYAFDQAIIAHQIIDIFNEICAIQFPEISRKPVFEVFIGMATGSYDYAEPLPQDKKTLMEMKFKRDAGELVITHERKRQIADAMQGHFQNGNLPKHWREEGYQRQMV
ncbi:MAG: hypothetical protein II969_08515 [Anaerolineaceae bacterium]|nr:hypothetical protein [Anaerolineaceae bacterium]